MANNAQLKTYSKQGRVDTKHKPIEYSQILLQAPSPYNTKISH